jgi:hypothetical protein
MRFSQVITLTLVSSVFASPRIMKRDLATIEGQIDAVNAKISIVDNTVKALTASSDVGQAAATLTAQSGDIVSALQAGTTAITNTDAISLNDALTLNTYSNALVDNVNQTVTDFISKKDIIVAGGQAATVVTQLQAQKDASSPFIDAIVSKVPDAAQGIAKSQASKVLTSLDQGIAAFS